MRMRVRKCKFCGKNTTEMWREDRWWAICPACDNPAVWGVDKDAGKSCEEDLGLDKEYWLKNDWRYR